ncbi:MAG: hypothetical protein R6V17_05860 [Halanaerobacter sp.]
MGYSDDDSMVRVDFFKPTGKWYATEAIQWRGYGGDLYDEFKISLSKALWEEEQKRYRMRGRIAVCLKPYNVHSYPLMVQTDEAFDWRNVPV